MKAWAQYDLTELEDEQEARGAATLVGRVPYSTTPETWRADLASLMKYAFQDVENYREIAICENAAGNQTFGWGDGEYALGAVPQQEDFPLSILCLREEGKSTPPKGAKRPSAFAEPSPGPAGAEPRGSPTGSESRARQERTGTQGTGNPNGVDVAAVLKESLLQSSELFSNTLRDVVTSIGRGGAGGPGRVGAGGVGPNGQRMQSTIKVEPRLAWPELGADTGKPDEAEDFIRSFESMCRLANNGQGMNPSDMVMTIGNCLKKAEAHLR